MLKNKISLLLLLTFCFIKPKNYAPLLPLQTSVYLNKVTFKSNIPFSQEEFKYLIDLKPNTFITNKEIEKAYKHLIYKKRFSQIDIEVNQEKKGINLNFKLTSHWIFKRLRLKGIWFGEYNYTNLYLQQPGDIFDILLHEESVKAIKLYLYNKGYFNGIVQNELIYKKNDKSIIVIISIKKNKRFLIKSVEFKIVSKKNKNFSQQKLNKFKNRLKRKIAFDLIDNRYSKKFIFKSVEKIRNFFKKKGFCGCHVTVKRLINMEKHTIHISFYIKLGKRMRLFFQGNKLFSYKYIKQNILGLDYPSWLFSPEIIAEQILHEYYKKGHRKVIIHYKKTDNDCFSFNIKEGNPIIIDTIEIKDTKNNIILEHAFFFNELLKKRTFDDQLLQKSINNLKKHYCVNGFWDFTILGKRFIKNENKNYKITLITKTGKQRLWGGVKIDGFEALEKMLQKTPFIPFNIYWLQEQKLFLLSYFQKLGYWYVQVQPELSTTFLQNQKEKIIVFVNWKIKLGPKIRFGKLLVRGNTKLPFKRIAKELQFRPGDLWDRKKLDQTRKRLKKLDIFKHIQLQPYKLPKNKETVEQPVILTLIDDEPLQASIRGGYFLTSKNFLFKRESTYKLGTSLFIKNPTNRADKLSLNADFTRFERKFNFYYQIPSPFGFSIGNYSIIGKFKGYVNKYVHPVQIGQSGSAYEAYQNGFSFGINNEYKQDYFWGINIGNEWLKTSRVRGNLRYAPEMINKTLPFFFIEPNLIIDKLDNKLDVKKGSLSFFSLKFMIPENNASPTGKLMAEQSFFYPIFKNIIGCTRIRFGHIFRREFEHIQPVERFYLGGPYSVRGYEKDAVPPLGVTEEIKPDGSIEKKYTIQGGASMLNSNFEIRFPIYKSFKGVVFQDIGVLSQSGLSGFVGKWFPATGFGLRYKTPIGAIRFDIGWKWKHRLPGDSAFTWYLTLGEAF